jgi:hypothetical protein
MRATTLNFKPSEVRSQCRVAQYLCMQFQASKLTGFSRRGDPAPTRALYGVMSIWPYTC